jgi:cadmium resistance protein CadD (predicted permease)
MLSNDFKINEVDKCVYVKNIEASDVFIGMYVDDMHILDNNDHVIKFIKKILTNKFDITNLGIVNIILGIKTTITSN